MERNLSRLTRHVLSGLRSVNEPRPNDPLGLSRQSGSGRVRPDGGDGQAQSQTGDPEPGALLAFPKRRRAAEVATRECLSFSYTSTDSSGNTRARKIAAVSSIPGSVSMMTCFVSHGSYRRCGISLLASVAMQ
jgi:hypothetical protein